MKNKKSTLYKNNKNLKAAGVKQNFTAEQIGELAKCFDDPIYFIKKYCKIVNIDKGLIPFDLYPFQERMIKNILDNRYSIAKLPRQSGKCVVGSSNIVVRNKKTGEIKEMKMADFHHLHLKPS